MLLHWRDSFQIHALEKGPRDGTKFWHASQPGVSKNGVVDPATHTVERGGRAIDLTPKEFALLEYLMRHPNQVVTREMIEQHIWNYDFECESNVIDVYVRRLRRKIDDSFAVKLLLTVRGVGYRLQAPPEQG